MRVKKTSLVVLDSSAEVTVTSLEGFSKLFYKLIVKGSQSSLSIHSLAVYREQPRKSCLVAMHNTSQFEFSGKQLHSRTTYRQTKMLFTKPKAFHISVYPFYILEHALKGYPTVRRRSPVGAFILNGPNYHGKPSKFGWTLRLHFEWHVIAAWLHEVHAQRWCDGSGFCIMNLKCASRSATFQNILTVMRNCDRTRRMRRHDDSW